MALDDVRIEYSDRKTLGLIVERDSSILVRALRSASPESIQRFLESKRYWLGEKTNHSRKYPAIETLKEFVSGQSFLFLGRKYRLEIVEEEFEGLRFEDRFVLSRSRVTSAHAEFLAWYVAQARERIVPRTQMFAEQMGVEYKSIKISDLRVRWGSCTLKNNLNFNWRLIKAPSEVIDYIIVHELAHLIEPNHSSIFWGIVSVQVPDYHKSKVWLVENGAEIEAKP